MINSKYIFLLILHVLPGNIFGKEKETDNNSTLYRIYPNLIAYSLIYHINEILKKNGKEILSKEESNEILKQLPHSTYTIEYIKKIENIFFNNINLQLKEKSTYLSMLLDNHKNKPEYENQDIKILETLLSVLNRNKN